ncbi:MAG: restriction endonuclease [Parcubacteria group bacterium]|nr:restriction endonuclease [Parcubacteria group bacterium]
MEIIKATGEKELFEHEKLCGSLRASGAPSEVADKICNAVAKDLSPGATTTEIFREALRHLVKENIGLAARYSLKRGMAELGPAGFYFEQFVEAILRAEGYTTARNQFLRGECVTHEVDIVAYKGDEHYFIEAKYKNKPHLKTHVDVVAYAWARLDDIRRVEEKKEGGKAKHYAWVITNTKLTLSAIQYANCKNIKTTSWSHPNGEALENLIAKHALYPVTVLPSVNSHTLEIFAKHGMMLAQDLIPYTAEDLETKFGIKKAVASKINKEAQALLATAHQG